MGLDTGKDVLCPGRAYFVIVNEDKRRAFASPQARVNFQRNRPVGGSFVGLKPERFLQRVEEFTTPPHVTRDVIAHPQDDATYRPVVKQAVKADQTVHIGFRDPQVTGDVGTEFG